MSDTFLGLGIQDLVNQTNNRYFYGLRRTDDGDLYIQKLDQLSGTDSMQINKEGDPANNYEDFNEGEDFFEGRNVNHERVYLNLNYEQFRWDNRNINYYIDDDGNLVAKVNQGHTYPTGV